MPTFKSEFIDLAAELIGDEFSDFTADTAITQSLGFDYATQSNTTQDQTRQMIPLEYTQSQIDGTLIKTGDIMLIGEYQLFEWEPSPDNTTLTHAGKSYALRNTDIDPAGATIVLHCRPL